MKSSRMISAATCALLAALGPALAWAQDSAAPVPDKGDTAWMLVSTLLVIMMAVPGLALFYGGQVRSKNVLSVLMQVLVVFSLLTVLWVAYGYSLAFNGPSAYIGDLSRFFLRGITPDTNAATFTDGVVIPEFVFVAFQATFAQWLAGGWHDLQGSQGAPAAFTRAARRIERSEPQNDSAR